MGKPLRVLLIEDSEDDALLLQRELSRGGFDVTCDRVETPEGMKAALEDKTWDIIISDYVMPHFGGLEAVALLKETGLDIPFIMVSGKLGEETAVDAMKAGAHDYILKDNLSRLVPAIKRELDEAEVRRDLKRKEERLKDSYEQIRALSSRLQLAAEDERKNIAREIHDELGQALTAIRVDVSFLKKEQGQVKGPSRDRLESIMNLLDSADEAVKNISGKLRPPLLDEVGLSAAIAWQAGEFEKRTGIKCDLTLDPEEIAVDKRRSTALFRIFQEILTNVARHSKATRVTAVLEEKSGTLTLEVKDNGVGITQVQIDDPTSFGLLGMRERLYPWQGELSIEGKPDGGTWLKAVVPPESQG